MHFHTIGKELLYRRLEACLPNRATSAPATGIFWSRLKCQLFIISFPSTCPHSGNISLWTLWSFLLVAYGKGKEGNTLHLLAHLPHYNINLRYIVNDRPTYSSRPQCRTLRKRRPTFYWKWKDPIKFKSGPDNLWFCISTQFNTHSTTRIRGYI